MLLVQGVLWCMLCMCIFTSHITFGLLVQDLGGEWNVKDSENEYNLPAWVPGGIYSDLMNNNTIADVFVGFNDVESRWVAHKNWTYSRMFIVSQEILDYKNIRIVFEGIDTFATVYINDDAVGSSDNMFVRYTFDVKKQLKLGDNSISVSFQSPVEVARNLFNVQAKDYIVPPKCVPDEYNGECHVNHIRKMQASFAWDWGPAFPSVGIWKPLFLEAYTSSVLRDVIVNIKSNGDDDTWNIEIHTYFAKTSSEVLKGTLLVNLYTDIERIENIYDLDLTKNENDEFISIHRFSVPKLYVKLWWPNGYGSAQLYQMKVTFVSHNEADTSIKRFKVGFRTINLIQNTLENGNGRTFYFVVNNVPIFAKGTNSIPVNILPEKGQDSKTVRFLLESAKDAHMNMIRVWGGGVYESDEFYEIADELGILIWQDFMFACSMYPASEDFLRTVKDEVKHQVRRLQFHPSVAIWAANNENEAALRQNWYGTDSNFDVFKADFVKLYVDTIREEVFKTDTSRQFLTSSPTNGVQSEKEGFVARNPQSTMYGDVHFYNYFLDSWNQNIYPITRFASEYGYQSLPSLSTLVTAVEHVEDLQINSTFMLHRQHHLGGYNEMKNMINDRLPLPQEDSANYYKAFIFYGQIVQAMAIKLETEYYRLWRSSLTSAGEGLTMGALYWQLNDVWVAPTWSGIDFQNNWKMLHYYAKNFFAPVIITGHLHTNKNLSVFVVSDLLNTITNATVTLSVYIWDSLVPVRNETYAINVLPGMSKEITTFWTDEFLSESGCGTVLQASKRCFIYMSLHDADSNLAPHNFVFPSALNNIEIPSPTVQVASIKQIDGQGKEFEIELMTDAVALFVWLDSGSLRGRFSDNGFIQVTERETISFYAEYGSTTQEVIENVKVTHLFNSEFL